MPAPRANEAEVLVLGAGLAGSCTAIALAHDGHHVAVVERAGSAMSGASGNTEAKIHLGYVYALDRSFDTQRRMLAGALSFAPLLDRWVGPLPWDELRTPTFRYAVMPDSLLGADELAASYARVGKARPAVERQVERLLGGPGNYLGRPFYGHVLRVDGDDRGPIVDGRPVETSFETEEAGVAPDALSHAIRSGLEHPSIDLHVRTEVTEARRDDFGFAVAVTDVDEATAWWRARTVVNCLWEDRLRVDATVGVESPIAQWAYRTKYLSIVRPRTSGDVPTTTMVQGPYGDVIPWDPQRVCLSWYPRARTELRTVGRASRNDEPWHPGPPPRELAEEIVAAMAAMFPGLVGAKVVDARGGVIIAPGSSDIDDRRSELHARARPAVHEHDGWWSIDTGKYTLAPLLAHEASQRISAALRGR